MTSSYSRARRGPHGRHSVEDRAVLWAVSVFSVLVSAGTAAEMREVGTPDAHGDEARVQVIYVDQSAIGGNDGSSWSDAFIDLQDALAIAVAGNQIWVVSGSYAPDRGTGDFEASFRIVDGAAIYGGFVGGEESLDQRNVLLNVTILSGQIGPGYLNKSCHVVTAESTGEGTLVDGFTITEGYANDLTCDLDRGSGVYVDGGHVTFRNCIITEHATGGNLNGENGGPGAGIYARNANLLFIDCELSHNAAGGYFYTTGAGSGCGGGLFADSAVVFVNCDLLDNFASAGGTPTLLVGGIGGDGGAICSHGDGALALINCMVARNHAGSGGSGGEFGTGGHAGSGGATVGKVFAVNCAFIDNHAGRGGNGWFAGDGGSGGAVAGGGSFGNCTFAGNSAGPGGATSGGFDGLDGIGGAVIGDSNSAVQNSVLWGNTPDQIGTTASITYSCVEDGWPGQGNISDDPGFLDLEDADARLSAESPCIDAASNDLVERDTFDVDADGDVDEAIPNDVQGALRFYDDPTAPDTGQGSPPVVDMGAYEYFPDCNINLIPDDFDIIDDTSDDANQNGVPDECEQATIFVDQTAEGVDNGLTWEDAFTDLQDALLWASVNETFVREVWVATGRYTPDRSTGDRRATFELKNNLAILGGFSAGGSQLEHRDPEANETILSGDLNGDDLPDFENTFDNSRHVVTVESVGVSAVLDGLVISGGETLGFLERQGAGLYSIGSDFTLVDCVFRSHSAHWGAAIYVENASPQIIGCTFEHNQVWNGGGAMYNKNASTVVIDSVFRDNADRGSVNGANGGAVYNDGGSPTFVNCSLVDNAVLNDFNGGGAMYNAGQTATTLLSCQLKENSGGSGAAVFVSSGHTRFSDCLFESNVAIRWGGAVLTGDDAQATVQRCVFADNGAERGGALTVAGSDALITDSLFIGNHATLTGGALNTSWAATQLRNCTLAQNTAGEHGGGVFIWNNANTLTVADSILWNNTDAGGSGEPAQLNNNIGGDVSVDYSCLQGWTGTLGGIGNIGDDPLFTDPGIGDLRLTESSTCINRGDPEFTPEPGAIDLDGKPRVVCGIIDMGAYEFDGIVAAPGDFNCDGMVDLFDFAERVECVTDPNAGPPAPGCQVFDFDEDGDVDWGDFASLQRAFNGSG